MSEFRTPNKVDKDALYRYLEGDDSKVLIVPKNITTREKKVMMISTKFSELSNQAVNGFTMGALVGGAMGSMIGIWTMMKTRKPIVLPISIISTGSFLGFVMMCGSVVRN